MKIGFIGLGIMGESMCENIVKKHNDTVFACDHKQSQIVKLVALGAKGCNNEIETAQNAVKGLNGAQGLVRGEVTRRLRLRKSPELKFVADDSVEHGMKIFKMLDDIKVDADED